VTEEEMTLLAIKGLISDLAPEQREQCEAMAEHLRRMIEDAGDVGTLAFALVGAELQAGKGEA
jgi:hypothetical protein